MSARQGLDSLALRLTVFAALASLVGLFVAGIVLHALYTRSAERTFDARLQVYLALLVANSVSAENRLVPPETLGDPRFDLPLSGWYWQIRPFSPQGGVSLSSPSLFDVELAFSGRTRVDEAGYRRGAAEGPADSSLRMIERQVRLGPEGDSYIFSVAANDVELRVDVATFRRNLIVTLAVFAICLVAVFFVQVRYGLRPLQALGRELWRVRRGDSRVLEGAYPREVQAVVSELNALIRANEEVVARARSHVGNLAHALKTPLSVLLNEARSGETGSMDKIAEQADLMNARIGHSLDRARMAAGAGVIGAVTEVEPTLRPLVRTLRRLYQERGLQFAVDLEADLRFRGERQDLEELVGNLLDNACKWADRAIRLTAERASRTQSSGESLAEMLLVVEDDGPGLDAAGRVAALERGRRLDESRPGSGLGLSIVRDLVTLYGGTLRLDRALNGGLRVVVRLPAI